jgi:ribosome-binding factor A
VKRTPELVFKPDMVARDAARIEGIIRDMNTPTDQ